MLAGRVAEQVVFNKVSTGYDLHLDNDDYQIKKYLVVFLEHKMI